MKKIKKGAWAMLKPGVEVGKTYGGIEILRAMMFRGLCRVENDRVHDCEKVIELENGFYYSPESLDFFEEGTKVRIKTYPDGCRPCDWNDEGEMDKYMGTVGTVCDIFGDTFCIKEDDFGNCGAHWIFDVSDIDEVVYEEEAKNNCSSVEQEEAPDWTLTLTKKNGTVYGVYVDSRGMRFEDEVCDEEDEEFSVQAENCIERIKEVMTAYYRRIIEVGDIVVVEEGEFGLGHRGRAIRVDNDNDHVLVDFVFNYEWTFVPNESGEETCRWFNRYSLRKA